MSDWLVPVPLKIKAWVVEEVGLGLGVELGAGVGVGVGVDVGIGLGRGRRPLASVEPVGEPVGTFAPPLAEEPSVELLQAETANDKTENATKLHFTRSLLPHTHIMWNAGKSVTGA